MGDILDVHIGEVKVAKNGQILRAILGSCIGIGILWERKQICGLSHSLLPMTEAPPKEFGARYVNQAIFSLKSMMQIKSINRKEIEIIVVGGANMTGPILKSTPVGERNLEVALSELKLSGFRPRKVFAGGEHGRRVMIYSDRFEYDVEQIALSA